MITKYEEQMYNDIHRIAVALEKIAKSLEQQKQSVYNLCETNNNFKIKATCPSCCSQNVKEMYGTINLDGSNNRTHYMCLDCHKEFDV